jgi:outer membrane protein TolC
MYTVHCALCAVLAGCSNPLASSDADSGHRPPAARLRSIERLDRDKYAQPAPTTPEPPTVGAKHTSRFAGLERAEMTLEDARAAALENNLDLRVALADPLISTEALRAEEAKFEMVFRPFTNVRDINQPTLDTTSANQQKTVGFGGAVDVPLRTGGRASVDFTESRSTTNNPFFALNTSYNSALTFSLSQPLLRNAGRRTSTHSIRVAAYDRDIAEARTKLEIIRQVANADRAYWRLYAAGKALEVRQTQYEAGLAQLERARRRVRAGAAAELEVTRAEAGAASQLEQIILAEKALLDQQREIKRLLNIKGLEMETKTLVTTTTDPDPVRYLFDAAELAEQGVANRMEMLELELQLAQDYTTIEFNKNQALPQFTLDFSYSIPGLGGNFGASIDQLAGTGFRAWQAGLSGQIPIGNEQAKARVRQAILTRLQRLSTKEARTLAIRQEVLGAVDAIDAAWQRIMAARQSVVLAARTLEGEQRQFDAGARTSTDVLDAAARLADEQTNEIRALADYQIAQVDLAFATGTLLGAGKIDWEPRDPRIGQPAGGDPTPFSFPHYDDPAKARTPAQAEQERK